jgi:hypothetical protein
MIEPDYKTLAPHKAVALSMVIGLAFWAAVLMLIL